MSNQSILLDLINSLNEQQFSLTDLAFGLPRSSEEGEYNTDLTVTARPASRFSGEQTINYQRLDIAEHFLDNGIEVVELPEEYRDAPLSGISEIYLFDFVESEVQSTSEGTIVMGDNSLLFTGQLQIVFTEAPVQSLSEAFPQINLDQLQPPTAD